MSSEADNNNLFRYQYGELNDVTPPAGPLDRQSSGRDNAFTRLGRFARDTYRPDPYGSRQEWYGQVLRVETTPEEDATEDDFSGWERVQRRFKDNPDLVRIKVRIPELHATITEPRNLSADPEALTVEDQLAIDRHPTFVAQTEGFATPNVGDVVRVFYDRQSGQAIYLGRVAGTGVAATAGGINTRLNAVPNFAQNSGLLLAAYSAAAETDCMTDACLPPQNANATELSVNTSKVWPWYAEGATDAYTEVRPGDPLYWSGKTITLVVFYHGINHATQDWMINNSQYGVKEAMEEMGKDLENTLFLFPTPHNVSWATVAADIQKLQDDHNITIQRKILGGFSGGSLGGGQAMDSDMNWDLIYWADPSPNSSFLPRFESPANEANYAGKQAMYYNKSNWDIEGFDTDTGFDTLVQRMTALGNSAVEVSDDHNTILKNIFKLIGGNVN